MPPSSDGGYDTIPIDRVTVKCSTTVVTGAPEIGVLTLWRRRLGFVSDVGSASETVNARDVWLRESGSHRRNTRVRCGATAQYVMGT
jgi:hypothetical protein